MQYFFTFSLFLVIVTAESNPVHVQNNNINIIVNADSKEIAKELWKIIERHVKQDGISIPLNTTDEMEKNTVREIEQVIRNVVAPSRRSSPLTDSDLAKNFERIVRRSISVTGTSPLSSPFDRIKNIDDIVVEMVLAVRKLLDRSEPEFIIEESDGSTGTVKLEQISPGSATPSSSLHRIMRGPKDTKNGSKNRAFLKNSNPGDLSATFDPVINSNQYKSTKINPSGSVQSLKDDVDDELKSHEGKRWRKAEESNVNVNENIFARRYLNKNINRNQFHHQSLPDNGVYDDDLISSYRGPVRSPTRSQGPPMQHMGNQIPKNSNRRNYNYNSNSNAFGPGSGGYQNKLSQPHKNSDKAQSKYKYGTYSPGNDYSDDSGLGRPASGNSNVNKNTNNFSPFDDLDNKLRKPSISSGKNPARNNNQARSRGARARGNSNVNSNENQVRGAHFASKPKVHHEDPDDWNYGFDYYYDDIRDDMMTKRLKNLRANARHGGASSENVNSNTNSFRRSQNSNINENSNYFRRNAG